MTGEIPGELKRRRLALGLTQAALAHELGVAPNTIAVWERGELRIEHPDMLDAALWRLEVTCRYCGQLLTHHDNVGCCRKCALTHL